MGRIEVQIRFFRENGGKQRFVSHFQCILLFPLLSLSILLLLVSVIMAIISIMIVVTITDKEQ